MMVVHAVSSVKDRMAQIKLETQDAVEEREKIMEMQPTRKTEERLAELKTKMVTLSEEQTMTHDKIVGVQTTENKRKEYREKSISKLSGYIEGVLNTMSKARDIKGLPSAEEHRAQSSLHRYFDQVKDYQEVLKTFQELNKK